MRNWIALLAVMFLVACGGGGAGTAPFGGTGTSSGGTTSGGSTGGGSTSTASPSISMALSSNVVTALSPATVTVTVKDTTGAGVAGQVVKFATTDGLGTFSVASALTNASGEASVVLSASSSGSGADQVTASTTVNGTAVSASQGFQLTAPTVAISAFTSDLGASRLSAYGQTNLGVTVTGAVAGTPVQIALSSTCVAKGKATLTPASVATTTGTATFTYRDAGCGATDTSDSVQATVSGSSASSSLNIPLTSPTVASINFASATPATIFLRGSGLTETSTVVFRVLDTAGNGLPNQSVRIEPTTLTGGLTLDGGAQALTKLSDSLGNVNVLINSGTVPTPVRVKATLVNSAISTVSSGLSIAVGLPSQLNFSLAQQTINIEGFNIDGTANTYSIIASDRVGNPVPAGTSINFVAEGSQIEASKQTELLGGLARTSANFASSEPRPADGRITIVAYALGEESFLDTNGDNVYTAGEQFQDLGNIYLNRKFDGNYDPANDQFIALALPGAAAGTQACATPASPLLAGSVDIPSQPATCDATWGRAYVRRAVETVLSTSSARPLWATGASGIYATTCAPVTLGVGYDASGNLIPASFNPVQGSARYDLGKTGVVSFIVADANSVRLNPMAAGTVISATATTGLSASVAGGSPVPSTSSATFVSINFGFDDVTTSGSITVGFASPSGVASSATMFVSRAPAPGTGACP